MYTHGNRYLEQQVLTATREQLLLLTYDGVLRFLALARQGLQRGDYHQKHLGITRAQVLLLELRSSLDFSVAPELAQNLASIYSYLVESLARADLADDEEMLGHITALVSELREAWQAAAQNLAQPSGKGRPRPAGGAPARPSTPPSGG